MIYVNLTGGLGNQMFEYAFALSLAEKFKDEICIDLSRITNKTHEFYSLDHFNIGNINIVKHSTFPKLLSKIISHILPIIYNNFKSSTINIIEKFFIKFNLHIFNDGYVKLYKNHNKIYVNGYFQSKEYFSNIDKKIKSIYTVKDPILKSNIILYNKIQNTNSVCVHIRRGDYTQFSNHLVCTIDYYKKAMDIINDKLENPEFFIFSDDIPWVMENIKFNYRVNYIDKNNPNYEELRLMYSCKHFIISNSTFSWWAQYLSTNKNKIVISPSKWFNNPKQKTKIMQDDWIRIDV